MGLIKCLLYASLTFILLTSCGLKIGAIRSVDATKAPPADKGIVVGRVRFIVDGKELKYNLLNRPVMRLFRFSDGEYYETPMVDTTGAFSWQLPEGEYEIALLGGGMCPVGQPMLMRNSGVFWQVNGFSYPGYRLLATSGNIYYLGTLVVDVNSRKMNAVIDFTGERVFDSLNRIQIVDDSSIDPKWQSFKDSSGAVIELFEPISFKSRKERKL